LRRTGNWVGNLHFLSIVNPLLPVMLPVVICAGLGMLWSRTGQPFDQEFVRRLVMWIGAPALIVGTMGEVDVPLAELRTAIVATLLLLGISAVLALLVCLILGFSARDFMVSLVFGNFGNMGLPLCLFAFGEQGLVIALTILVVTSLLQFSLGVAVLNGSAAGGALLRSPIVYAGVVAGLMVFCSWRLPLPVSNTLGILGDVTVPLMLITLGISLSSLHSGGLGRAFVLACLRLVIGISAGVLTVYVMDLQGVMRKAFLLQSAMPTAVFNYLLAMQYRREPETVAGLVLWSTLLSFITIPLLLHFIGLEA
jgi:malate permease and related proteins